MTGLPCLSLHQPYPTLIVLGVKGPETRGWPAPKNLIGAYIGVHATQRRVAEGQRIGDWATWRRNPLDWLAPAGEHEITGNEIELSRGAIVGTARIVSCIPISDGSYGFEKDGDGPWIWCLRGELWLMHGPYIMRNVTEFLPYGDYTPGRYAWVLDDEKPTTERCPWCMGECRIFDDVEAHGHTETREYRCPVCSGAGHCPPIPAKGKQRIWRWNPEGAHR